MTINKNINSNFKIEKQTYKIKCPKTNEESLITIIVRKKIESKHDLIETSRKIAFKCDLVVKKYGVNFYPCMVDCSYNKDELK